MKTDVVENLAKTDAEKWLLAEMFYGEGSGTRRKLLYAEIDQKMKTMPAYTQAFDAAYEALDQSKFARLAIKEREKIDRATKHTKNLKAFKSGNLQNLTTGVYLVVAGVIIAHHTGYDKVIANKARELSRKAKTEYRFRKAKAQGLNVEKI